jgi:hypothetical protein
MRAAYPHRAGTPWHFPDGGHNEAIMASTKNIEADLPILATDGSSAGA